MSYLRALLASLAVSFVWIALANLAHIGAFDRGWWAGWISLAVFLASLYRTLRRSTP